MEKIPVNDGSALSNLINHYVQINDPGYAILVTGEWGSGKTYQIKNLYPENSAYYISLFGLKTAEEIHSNVFSAMYPLKSALSKGADGLAETGIEGFGLSLNLGNLAPSIISALIKREAKNDKIIIFDDFERCATPIKQRLGAINTYIEHKKCHVVVVSNNEKIAIQEFSDAKEKLFGYTINIEPDSEVAFDSFLKKWEHHKNHEQLKNLKNELISVLRAGNINSLRIMKHILSDLISLISLFDEQQLANKKATTEIAKLFTAFSAEVRSGGLGKAELIGRIDHSVKYYLARNNPENVTNEANRFNTAREKYIPVGVQLESSLFSDEFLANSLINGNYEKEKLSLSLNSSKYFSQRKDMPTWRKLMDFDESDDVSTDEATNELIIQFNNRQVSNPGEILHLCALIFLISSLGILNKNFDEAKNDCFKYIDELQEKGGLPAMKLNFNGNHRLQTSYDGYGYYVLDEYREHFNEVYNYLIIKIGISFDKYIESKSQEFTETLRNDTQEFIENIYFHTNGKSQWADIPVLKHISIDDFFKAFSETPRSSWHHIKTALENRYSHHQLIGPLQTELDWASSLVEKFEKESENLDGFRKYRLERATPTKIKPAIASARAHLTAGNGLE